MEKSLNCFSRQVRTRGKLMESPHPSVFPRRGQGCTETTTIRRSRYQYSNGGIIHRLLPEVGESARNERPRGSEIASSWEKPEENAQRASVTRACMRACERAINTYRDTSRSIAYSARVFSSASTPEIDLSGFRNEIPMKTNPRNSRCRCDSVSTPDQKPNRP